MKRRLLPFIFLLLALNFGFSQIYVDSSATGANNGTSWSNAYTDLKTALNVAVAGNEIWVAKGTYKPDTPNGDPASTFLINKNLKLLGGFNGTEMIADQRDPEANETILSGDLNGDDVEDDFTQNRSDNVLHVMQVNANITNETLIDGFTVEGGQADGTGSAQTKSGGGINSTGGPTISNCTFEQNFATEFGGAIKQDDNSTSPLVLNNCLFQYNYAFQGLAVHLNLASFDVINCTFKYNTNENGNGGGLYLLNPRGGKVINCLFKENTTYRAGGLIAWNLSSANLENVLIEVLDCTFENNHSLYEGFDQGGGGLLFATGADNSQYIAKRCSFIGNTSNSTGAAVGLQINGVSENFSMLIDSCYFFQNITKNNGSAVYTAINGKNVDLEINRCEFIQNTTNEYSATVDLWGTNGGTGTASIDSCIFEGNTSFWSGAVEAGNGYNGGAGLNFLLTNNIFKNNHATEGGAIGFWSDQFSTSNFTVEQCLFEGNNADVKGGAIKLSPESSNFHVFIRQSEFSNNQGQNGGAIASSSGNIFPTASCLIENSLIANNTSDNATISIEQLPDLKLVNCTVADNVGGSIELASQSGLTLQNTILFNPGYLEYQDLTSDCIFTSVGGNLYGDNSIPMPASSDIVNGDPKFIGLGNDSLSEDSPCIDAGIDDGVTAPYDLAGNPRIQGNHVDIGAFESPFTIVKSTQEVIAGELVVSPNPASDFLNIQLPERVTAPLDVQFFDASGKYLGRQMIADRQSLNLKEFESGVYFLKVVIGEQVLSGKFIKQ